MTSEHILVVDDEPDIRQLVQEILEDEGYIVDTAENAAVAREKWSLQKPDLVLLDIWMPDEDGISLLKSWQDAGQLSCPVIMISGHATIETAIEATRLGAYDFIEKPLSMAKMLLTIENGLRTGQLESENKNLREQVNVGQEPIGSSVTMNTLREVALKFAKQDAAVLINGAFGTGKEILARYIHSNSSRANAPFVKSIATSDSNVDMGNLLFGEENDSTVNYGLFDEAKSGSVYLSDIGMLDSVVQRRLVDMLKKGVYRRSNGKRDVRFNARLIVSSSQDLREDLASGRFDKELYFLLDMLPMTIPVLKEHAEDVPDLLNYYVDLFTEKESLPYRHFSVAAQNYLRNYSWPGNIRELKNLTQRLLILGTETEISQEEAEDALGSYVIPVYDEGIGLPTSMYELPLRQAREQFEHDYLCWQLRKVKGNVSQLARSVKMERTHLYRKMHTLNIDPKDFN